MEDERPRIICTLVAWGPPSVEGAEVRWCDVCAAEVWVAPSSLEIPDGVPLCAECAPGVIALDDNPQWMATTEAQRAEQRAKGVSDADTERARAVFARAMTKRR